MNFNEVVMFCFDDKNFVKQWERLRNLKLHGKKAMNLFIKDVRNLVWERLQ